MKKSEILQIITEEINTVLIPESADQSHRLTEGENAARWFDNLKYYYQKGLRSPDLRDPAEKKAYTKLAKQFFSKLKEGLHEMKMVNKETGKDITKHVLAYMEKKITKKEFEKLTGLSKEKVKVTEISKEEKAAQFKLKLFLKKGLRLSVKDGEDKLYKYAMELEDLADDEYDEVVSPLFAALELVQDAGVPGVNNVEDDKEYRSYIKSADKHMKTFIKNAKKVIGSMKEGVLDEGKLTEAISPKKAAEVLFDKLAAAKLIGKQNRRRAVGVIEYMLSRMNFNESINEAKLKKGDIIKMQDGEYGVVNKLKGKVAYIKLKSSPGSFHPIEADRTTYKGKHKGKDLYLESLNEAKVPYNFSEDELKRVLKLLGRNASTEVKMIKAFEKALGRKLTRDELFEATSLWKHFDAKMKLQDEIMDIEMDMKNITATIKQLHKNMEQEAEPEGGKIADKYGKQLEKYEKMNKKRKAKKKKKVTKKKSNKKVIY